MIFTILVLAILASGLSKDFNRDSGQHKKAKIFHALSLVLLVGYFATAFRLIGWLFRHIDEASEKFYVNIGLIPAQVNLLMFILQLSLSIAIYIVAFNMVKRRVNTRKVFLRILPFFVLTETFNFYGSWTNYGRDVQDSSIAIMLGLVVLGGIVAGIIFLYTRPFMKQFFELQPDLASNELSNTDIEHL